MSDLTARIAGKFKDSAVEKKYLRSAAIHRLAGALLLLRKERGLTQKELAEKVGTTQTVISRLESASVKPSIETILKIAEALDAAVDVRLIPVEKMRRQSAEDTATDENRRSRSDMLQGIIYYDRDQNSLSQSEKWITTDNTSSLGQMSVKTPKTNISLKLAKIREYA